MLSWKSEVVEKLSASCFECTITDDIIDKQSFSCYTESPSFLTYRARLEGTSDTDSGSLISLIEEWVRGGASVILTGVLMKVDPDCPVAISSLSEEECIKIPLPTPYTTVTGWPGGLHQKIFYSVILDFSVGALGVDDFTADT